MKHINIIFISFAVVRTVGAWSPGLKPHTSIIARSQRTAMASSTMLGYRDGAHDTTTIAAPSKEDIQTSNVVSTDPTPYLIHKGRAVSMIKRCVAIEGLSLSRGWTPQATEAFKLAIG